MKGVNHLNPEILYNQLYQFIHNKAHYLQTRKYYFIKKGVYPPFV